MDLERGSYHDGSHQHGKEGANHLSHEELFLLGGGEADDTEEDDRHEDDDQGNTRVWKN